MNVQDKLKVLKVALNDPMEEFIRMCKKDTIV